MPFFRAMPSRFALAACLLCALAPPLQAQPLPTGADLGATAADLQRAMPDLERVARPMRMAGGLAGLWRSAPVALAGVVGNYTFFLAGGQVRRIEFFADAPPDPSAADAAFDAIAAWGRDLYGAEMASGGPGARYAAWSRPGVDIYLQQAPPPRAGVRLVRVARAQRDGSAL